jgi:putative membrane protein
MSMQLLANILIGIVALLHVWFMTLEMFLWTKPLGRKVFRLTPEFAEASKKLAMNQGLYNGFLVAGLVWGLWANGFHVKIFFLACVFVAGVFGAWSLRNRKVFFVQAFPALIALILLHLH